MPLLLCPNDNASMNTVSRNGVEFDMCPTCRGVWLDRGELENLMASQVGAAGHSSASIPTQPPRYEEPRRYDRDHDDRYKRKKRDSIFDIFD